MVIWLQTPTVLWLGGGTVPPSYWFNAQQNH